MANKLTDRTIFGASLASGDLMHIVDIDDVSQDPSGSSYKLPIGTLATYILTGAPIQSANNGLTLSGTTIKWGGALTANTVISGAKTLDFTNLTYFYSNNGNGTTNGWLYNDPAYAGFGWDAASGNILEAFTDGTQLSLHAVNGLNNAKFTLNVPSAAVTNNGTNNVFIINDSIESKGLVYAGDYTANFTPESLITKRFVTASYVPYTGATSNLNMGNHNVSFGSTYGIDTSAAPGTLSIGVTNANVINYGNSGTTTHNFSGTIPTGTLANGIKVLLGSDVKG
ncbi:MAG TPA: hypothetical protein VN026_18120, partial [Bacteroidia bacterium]|nr:hypothetical protein [Bacteroidia bacterium]